MAEQDPGETRLIGVPLPSDLLPELQRLAASAGTKPEELAGRWLRERLAHERERALGRERTQRPRDGDR